LNEGEHDDRLSALPFVFTANRERKRRKKWTSNIKRSLFMGEKKKGWHAIKS
jgi:hypothetical protein